MSYYRRAIAKDIGDDDPATLAIVEDIMRTNRSGLDGLTPDEFRALARQAYGDMRLMASTGALVGYCDMLRLDVPGRYLN